MSEQRFELKVNGRIYPVNVDPTTTTVMAPAIANAVFAQTGARLRSIPFTPDAVKAALLLR
jgi:isoquinoline 1-oxidoreductase subunit beta